MDNKQLGDKIVELVGGKENINSLIHCATRLRFRLVDDQKADKDSLDELPDVLSVVEQGGQFQIVIGNKVDKVYTQIMNNHNIQSGDQATEDNSHDKEKSGIMNTVFSYISGTLTPLIPALAGAGMIKALLALLTILNVMNEDGSTYAVLDAAADGLFYFLPIFIGVSAAKKLGANPFVGGVIAAGLLDPSFTALLETGGDAGFLGIPLIVSDYSSTVFPLLIAMAIYAPLERLLKKYTPDMIQLFFVPMVSILIMVPFTALVFGPFSEYLSTGIATGVNYMADFSPILTGIIIAVAWPFLVVLGIHWGVVPISINNFSHGGDILIPIEAGATFAQIGIAFGVFLHEVLNRKSDKNAQSISLAGGLSGLLAGVTEPIIYGVILRYRKVIPFMVIASAVGGAIIALFDVKVFTFVFNSILATPAYKPMTGYVIGGGAAFIVAVILVLIFGYKSKEETKNEEDNAVEKHTADKTVTEKTNNEKSSEKLGSPLSGEMIPLEDIDDPVFSSGAMGKGTAVEPTDNVVIAPFDGKVATIFPTKHAIGLVSEGGAEVLIHIGLDTVQLDGKFYDIHVEEDSSIKKGDTLITFGKQGIKDAGYQITTPVIITNTDHYLDILPTESRHVKPGDPLLTIIE